MESFENRLAVVTGGASGMGREIVVQLAELGASVATCDLNGDGLEHTAKRAGAGAPDGVRITTHLCDVSSETDVTRFRAEVQAQHGTDHLDLLFNNAGIGGGGSFVIGDRDEWERTFNVCWGGVYNCTRAFLPLLVASDEAVLVNTSSVNGFWARILPGVPHTAYSTAKFAVKGFTEALIEDLRVNAPHVTVAVVMPGHVGTDIISNSRRVHGSPEPEAMGPEELATARADLARRGLNTDAMSDDDLRAMMRAVSDGFRDGAPTSSAEAATIILDGVRAGRWRILVGDDAQALDAAVRADPERAYEPRESPLSTITFG